MADQKITGIQIEIGLEAGKFEASGVRLEARAKKITEAFNQISGLKADQKLQEVQKAVERLGGVANLSAPQVERLRKELDSLAAAGAKIPKSLTLPKLQTDNKALASLKTEGLSQLQAQAAGLGPLGSALTAVGPAGLAAAAGIAAVGAAAVGTVAIVSDLVLNLAKVSSALVDMSAKTQLSTDFLQEIGFAGKLVGVTLEDIGTSAIKLSQKIGEGDKIFAQLGLSLEKLRSLSADQQFEAVAEAIKSIKDPTIQAAAAIEAFGKGGTALLPLIRSDMAGAREEAQRLGIVLGGDLLKAGDALDDGMLRLREQIDALKNTLAGELVSGGGLEGSLTAISEILTGLIAIIPTVVTGVKTLFGALSNVAGAIPGLGLIVSGTEGIIGQLREVGRLAQSVAPKPGTKAGAGAGSATVGAVTFDPAQEKAEAAAKKLGEARVKAAKDAEEAEKKYLKAVSDGIKQQGEAFAKLRADREKSSLALESTLTGGASEANLQSAQLQAQLIDEFTGGAKSIEEINAAMADLGKSLPADQLQNLIDKFDALVKAGAEVPQGLGPISDTLNNLNLERATAQMREAEAAYLDFMRTLAGAGALGSINVEMIDALAGVPPVIDEAKGATVDWQGELQTLANLAQTLPGIFGESLGGILSGVAGIGGAIKNLKSSFSGGLGGIGGALTGKQGIGALFGSLGQIGTIAGAAFGIGKSVVSGIKKLFGGESDASKAAKAAGKILGEKVSEEMGAEILARAKETGKTVEQVAKEIKFERLEAQFDDLKAKASEAVSNIGAGLAGFGQIKGAASAQGRIFGAQFAAVVQAEGFNKALDMFKETFASLPEEIKASVPADIQKLFAFGENEQFASAIDGISAMAEGFKGTIGLVGVSTELMADYGQVAQASFDQAKAGAIEAGATQEEAQKAALQATIPLLAQMKSAAAASGVALDPASAGLLAQAEAAGISIPIDPLIEVADILRQMLDLQRQMAGLPPLAPKVDTSQVQQGTQDLGRLGEEGGKRFTDGVATGAAGAGQALQQGLAGAESAGDGIVAQVGAKMAELKNTMASAGTEGAAAFEAGLSGVAVTSGDATEGVGELGDTGEATGNALTSGLQGAIAKMVELTSKAKEAAAAVNSVRIQGGEGEPGTLPPFDTGGIIKAHRRGSAALLHGLEAVIPLDREADARRVLAKMFALRPRLVSSALSSVIKGFPINVPQFQHGGFSSDSGVGAFSSDGGGGSGAGTFTIGPGAIQIGPITVQGGAEAGEDFASQIEQESPRISAALSTMIRRGIEASL